MKRIKKIFLIVLVVVVGTVVFHNCRKVESSISSSTKTEIPKNKMQNIMQFESLYGNKLCSNMSVLHKDNNLVVDVKDIEFSDKVTRKCIFPDYLKLKDKLIQIPKDGKTYWIISFDPYSDTPVIKALPGGGGLKVECNCKADGSCDVSGTINSDGTQTVTCTSSKTDPCSGCCSMSLTIPAVNKVMYSAVILTGNSVNYNGHLYE